MSINRFNLRVYALIVNEFDEILLSDEYRNGYFFTKFPGGGVEYGEGIIDALKRELCEELNLSIEEATFFYVNEFLQKSAFNPHDQLISFYYLIHLKKDKFSTLPYEIPFEEESERQRWVNLSELELDKLTFPIDKIVFQKLKKFKAKPF
ncbi:MAG: NUDIX hydrolase [Crocinitomicaceae bacterium]